jgi:hypothetical protein
MVRLTGFVIVEGRKVSLDWTLLPHGDIVSSGDLSPTNVNCSGMVIPPAEEAPAPAPLSTPTPAPAEEEAPTDYASMNKTELMTLCSQRGLSTAGTKADLIARLEADDSGETEAVSEGETDEESQPE